MLVTLSMLCMMCAPARRSSAGREGPPVDVEADAEVAGFDSSLVFLNHSHFTLYPTLHYNFSSTPH